MKPEERQTKLDEIEALKDISRQLLRLSEELRLMNSNKKD
jgi:hypothetical protein